MMKTNSSGYNILPLKIVTKVFLLQVMLALLLLPSAKAELTWTNPQISLDRGWNSVTYGNGTYVAVAGNTGNNSVTSLNNH